jgi:hypothetical protein
VLQDLMRRHLATVAVLAGLFPVGLSAQEPAARADDMHIAVESTTLVLNEERVRRLGLANVALSSPGVTISGGGSGGTVRAGTRVGETGISAWLDLVRSRRAVSQESTQRIVVLSGAAARVGSSHTLIGPYGQAATAGPELWVEPVALDGGLVRLRIWSAVGEVRADPHGIVWQDVPVQARTEIVVPSGTPVLIASTERHEDRTHRGLTSRASASASAQTWIVVTPRAVADAAQAFELPAASRRENRQR